MELNPKKRVPEKDRETLLYNEQSQKMHNEEGKRVIQDLKDKTERAPSEQLGFIGDELDPSTENKKGDNVFALPSLENSELYELAPFGWRKKPHQSQEDLVSSPTTRERIHRAALRKRMKRYWSFRRQSTPRKKNSIMGTFTKVAGRHTQSRNEMQIERKIPIMRRLMKNILGGWDDDATLKIPDSEVPVDLSALFSFGFGLADQTRISKEQAAALISNRPPYSVIETLVEAAVCTWVFESTFPNFEQSPKSLSLLATYKNIIATQASNYVPGTLFDPQTMDVEVIEAPTKSPTKEGRVVQYCLHVAIQAFTEEAVKNADPVSQATIRYKKFTSKLAAEPLEKIGLEPVILAKAIVVLKN
ncbi:hypothetical protein BELL_0807g00020 [Botrytis elliptica]|uniref:Uncharacterized protein n=1 Tax=Botrytis elliptica TaxID=278938 RepID=A0A4Z1J6E6_9HELO|nr:hypothetical protein BELL_0807g00020 [Botrytis elliptica]